MKHTHDIQNKEVFEKYSTWLNRKNMLHHPECKKLIFKTFQRTILPHLPVDKSANILDIACGEGTFLSYLKELGYKSLKGFDLSPENVSICHKLGLQFVWQQDVLEFCKTKDDEKFDLITGLDIM